MRPFDTALMIVKIIDLRMLLFPLEYRFRIWTIIWGTARLIRKPIEANPDFLEKACTLPIGVDEDSFSKVFGHPIPANCLCPWELEAFNLLVACAFILCNIG